MELSYIREFVVLAETGNYLEAADALFIACLLYTSVPTQREEENLVLNSFIFAMVF